MKMPGMNSNGFNPMQMFSQIFGNNGQIPQFDENLFRQMLPRVTEENINQLVGMARNFGMPEPQIQEGIKMLRQFRK